MEDFFGAGANPMAPPWALKTTAPKQKAKPAITIKTSPSIVIQQEQTMGFFDFLSSTRITSNEAKSLIKSGAQLIDVRTREEFAGGHISSAKNIPVQELASRLSELPNRTRKLVVYCRSGGRSATAASLLKQAGYEVFDLGAMTNYEA